jgi:serine/threonine protein kinase
MAICPSVKELLCYLNRETSLAPDEVERIELHVETCESCQRGLDRLTAGDADGGMTMPDLGAWGYRVYKHLGSGSFGEVWLAQDLNLWRVVALKTLDVRAAPAVRTQALEALRADARLLAGVEHPNVVRVYSWLPVHEHHYLVMQYVSGGSLADLLKRDGPLDWQRAARYAADVGEGLVEVHARGIVHRDVKPANILWDPVKDEALLTDFGVGARLDDPAAVAGSIPYMAPEAFEGRVAPSLDVYSLASTLFYLVTGSTPFAGPQISDYTQQIRRGLPDTDPRCAGIPEPLERIIRAGLTPDPARRPNLNDFVTTLRGNLNQLLVDVLKMSKASCESVPATELATGGVAKPAGEPSTEPEPAPPAPVDLRLIVSRPIGAGLFQPVAATHPQVPPGRVTRDMKKVPPPPDQVHLRTGERVRVEVVANRRGYLTVYNVGPTGNLNLLYPDPGLRPDSPPRPIEPNQPLHIRDVEMTPPAGRERLFAVWSREPLRLDQVAGLVNGGAASTAYRATRDMKRVQDSVRRLQPDSRHVVVVEVEHVS